MYKHKLINTLYVIYKITIIFTTQKIQGVYFTNSRSKFGCIKDLYLLLYSYLFKLKITNHLHGSDFSTFYNSSGILKPVIKCLYKKIDCSIILHESMKDQFIMFPQMKLKVIPNFYSEDFNNLDINLLAKQDQILYFSNILSTKGIFQFLDAMNQVLEIHKSIVVKIAGSFMADEYMTKKEIQNIFQFKLNNLKGKYNTRVQYLGHIVGKEKLHLFKESSIFILPTYYKTEALPISIIEAMRTGNVVITTNHNYLPLIFKNTSNFFINIKSVNEIVSVVNYLMENQDIVYKIQNNNIEFASSKYNFESVLADFIDFFQNEYTYI